MCQSGDIFEDAGKPCLKSVLLHIGIRKLIQRKTTSGNTFYIPSARQPVRVQGEINNSFLVKNGFVRRENDIHPKEGEKSPVDKFCFFPS